MSPQTSFRFQMWYPLKYKGTTEVTFYLREKKEPLTFTFLIGCFRWYSGEVVLLGGSGDTRGTERDLSSENWILFAEDLCLMGIKVHGIFFLGNGNLTHFQRICNMLKSWNKYIKHFFMHLFSFGVPKSGCVCRGFELSVPGSLSLPCSLQVHFLVSKSCSKCLYCWAIKHILW